MPCKILKKKREGKKAVVINLSFWGCFRQSADTPAKKKGRGGGKGISWDFPSKKREGKEKKEKKKSAKCHYIDLRRFSF